MFSRKDKTLSSHLKKVKTASKINLTGITFIAFAFLIQIVGLVILKGANNDTE
jgi:hypothetical protein